MAPYSMDLREPVAPAWDASGDRRGGRRDVRGEPRVGASLDPAPTGNRLPRAAPANEISIARVGRAGATTGCPDYRTARSHVGRAARRPVDHRGPQHGVVGNRSVGIDGQKKPYTPTNSGDLMSRPPAVSGGRRSRSTMPASTSSWMNQASPPIYYAATRAVRAARGSRITRPAATGRCTRWSRRSARPS